MRRLRVSAPLGLSAFGLALGAWMVSPAGAEDEAVEEAEAPSELPQVAFVTGPRVAHAAEVDGLAVEAKAVAGGYELTLRNASALDRSVRWEVDCSEVSGLAIGRMGPVATPVHHELVELRVPAGGETKHLVRAPHPTVPDVSEEMRPMAFASMRIELRAPAEEAPEAAQEPEVEVEAYRVPLAMLTVPAAGG